LTKRRIIVLYILFVIFCDVLQSKAQTTIRVLGQAFDSETKLPIPNLMVVNKRTNVGEFANNEGVFDLNIQKHDTLILSSLGYIVKKISFSDSLNKKQYTVIVTLNKLYYTLKEVTVYPIRSLSQIEKDLDKLGVKSTLSVQGIDALQSPITYLYERFSRFGKSKQKVANWENEDLKRDLLKELFRLYIRYDVIDLSDAEFDAFIKYLNFSDEFIKNASQLELVLAIKGKYESFKYRWK
jgi:hypothetical protein